MNPKLLLADDSITIQRVIELTFSGEDIDVVAVSDGEQAIARIATDKPDIILADIGMPRRSGYEVAAFVKAHPELSHIPVLLLAGAFEPVDETRATQVKCDGVLVKPFEPQHVIARVRELLGRVSPQASGSGPPVVAAGVAAAPGPELSPAGAVPATVSPVDPSLDDYFNRLDAAFATLGGAQARADSGAPDSKETFGGREVPTIDDVLAGASLRPSPAALASTFGGVAPPPPEPPDTTATLAPAPRPQVIAQEHGPAQERGPNVIADVFQLLFAVEQGEAEPGTVRVGAPAAGVPITDELVEQVTRRVLERLGPDVVRERVADVVSEVAERLVREEILRIRGPKA